MKRALYLFLFTVLFFHSNVQASTDMDCFDKVSMKYEMDPDLLRAIAFVESRFQPQAVNHNKNKQGEIISSDLGIMQINTINIEKLKEEGIIKHSNELLHHACFNVETGAWVLAKTFKKCGVNWECLGAYNAGFKQSETQHNKRIKYATKVYQAYVAIKQQKGLLPDSIIN